MTIDKDVHTPTLLAVECGACGWRGKRKPGNLVFCPKCGECAGFVITRARGEA